MHPVLHVLIPLALGAICFFAVYFLTSQLPSRLTYPCVGIFFSIGILIPVHYMHFFDRQAWYYEFRSIPYIELLSALTLALAGCVFATSKQYYLRSFSLIACTFLCILPFIKPALSSMQGNPYSDKWSDDICLQSTPYSCGPASIATILNAFGHKTSEAELASQFYTYSGGTENWHIARWLRRRGFACEFMVDPPEPAVPSLAGVKVGRYGHFIAILSNINGIVTIGDPLTGKHSLSLHDLRKKYHFTGWYMKVTNG